MTIRARFIHLLFLALVCAAFPDLTGAQSAPAPAGSSIKTISGTITDTDSEPLPGASIRIVSGGLVELPSHHTIRPKVIAETTSTGGGVFSLSVDISASSSTFVMLQAAKPGFATLDYFLWELMASPEDKLPDSAAISRKIVLPKSAPVSGIITMSDGTPVADATVSVVPTDSVQEGTVSNPATTTSTLDGRFEIKTMAAGPLMLSVSLDSRELLLTTATAPAKDLRFTVAAENTGVRGKVIDASTSAPVAGAKVTLFRAVDRGVMTYSKNGPVHETTGNDGTFEFTDLPAGRYAFQPEAPGLYPVHEILYAPVTEISAGEAVSDVIVEMAPGLEVSGHVYEMGTSTPVVGATVRWHSKNTITRVEDAISAADGKYVLTGISANKRDGFMSVTADTHSVTGSPSYDMERGSITVNFPPGETKRVVNVEMQPHRQIAGQVVDVDGNPLAGIQISTTTGPGYSSLENPVVTGQDGGFSISGSRNSDVVVFALKPGWPISSAFIRASEQDTTGTVITVAPGGSISGMVLTPDGQPAGNAHIQVDRDESAHESGMPNNLPEAGSRGDGTFLIENLPASKISLFCQKDGYAPTGFVRLEVGPGEHLNNVTLQLQKAYTITGRVTDSAGKPVADARVTARSDDSDNPIFANTQTRIDGRYELTGVADQIITIEVWATRQDGRAERGNIDPKSGTSQDFTLK